ncbi:uncharacterized protein LOC124148193 [Haliotis rufescens]|uniref:uncharacterized protein LOC124148193 n=1 Tax=Haliotis rufescens TaxID=6454 RepID=UPI001EAFE21F|nr:uncharacterized protein LOC124148193 [Haliotis rufescens]
MVSLLAVLFVLSSAVAMDIPITKHWDGGFRSDFCEPITQTMHHWTAHLIFDHHVDTLDIWVADVQQTLNGGKEFVLVNKASYGEQKAGDKLCVKLIGRVTGDIVPKARFYIEGMDGPVSATQKPIRHTAKPGTPQTFSYVTGKVLYEYYGFDPSDYKKGITVLQHGGFDEDSGSVVLDPAGTGEHVLKVFYEKGHYIKVRGHRGIQFYWTPISPQTTLTLSYDIYFDPNFDWVKGGKLPGLWGGSQTCSGGRHNEECFSTRFMWRTGGGGELYAYIPSGQRADFCTKNICNFDYGNSLGRDSWHFKKGVWQNIAQEVKLNTPGKQDGTAKVWYNGKQVYEINNVNFRTKSSVTIDGIFFSTFFGGSSPDWAPTRDSYVYFKNFVLSNDVTPGHIIG